MNEPDKISLLHNLREAYYAFAAVGGAVIIGPPDMDLPGPNDCLSLAFDDNAVHFVLSPKIQLDYEPAIKLWEESTGDCSADCHCKE